MDIPVRLKFSLSLPSPFTGKIQLNQRHCTHNNYNLALQQKNFHIFLTTIIFDLLENKEKNQLILKHESCF